MEKFKDWWKQDKRYLTFIKALLLAALPVVCCLVYCLLQEQSIGQVYLPMSEWNDELFYYKQVEGIVKYGYPQGFFGFNESHALKLSFAAWSPVLVFPWIIWGLLFGWNLMSPVICNILLMSLACFLFVCLTKPKWKQLLTAALLFCLYTPFVRYMLSVMPEVICFSLLIIFYSLALNYLNRKRGWKIVLLFIISGVLTLMRPYMLLFMLLPAGFRIQAAGQKGRTRRGVLSVILVFAVVLGAYAAIKHYLGAQYFTPLFSTDWLTAFLEQGVLGGIRYAVSKLHYRVTDFTGHTLQGFRTGLASGAIFAGYLIMLLVLTGQSIADKIRLGQLRYRLQRRPGKAEKDRRLLKSIDELSAVLTVEAHLAFSFAAMLLALLLMYKLTEGSKHLLTFMAAGIFVISMMETRFYEKTAVMAAAFLYFYSYKAVDPYDYQVPFREAQTEAQIERWRDGLSGKMSLDTENVPGYENVVIWIWNQKDGEGDYVKWQLLYALPEGFGISCCEKEYITENFDSLQSRYIATLSGDEIDIMCRDAGYEELYRDEDMAMYRR